MLLAALFNALHIVGKSLNRLRIAMVGMGAANVAPYRLLKVAGIDPAGIIACDRKGILHRKRHDIEEQQADFVDKWTVCRETNDGQVTGGITEALRGADVCIAFSAGGIIQPAWVATVALHAILFACANPVPEIWPWEAKEAGAMIVGTGRSDFPNQVNNPLVFPAVFRGVLDVRARTITDAMAIAAAQELAGYAVERGIHTETIPPTMEEWEMYPSVAVRTALKAQEQGVATLNISENDLRSSATTIIQRAREGTKVLMKARLIPDPP